MSEHTGGNKIIIYLVQAVSFTNVLAASRSWAALTMNQPQGTGHFICWCKHDSFPLPLITSIIRHLSCVRDRPTGFACSAGDSASCPPDQSNPSALALHTNASHRILIHKHITLHSGQLMDRPPADAQTHPHRLPSIHPFILSYSHKLDAVSACTLQKCSIKANILQ